MKCNGQIISQGKAYGKAKFLSAVELEILGNENGDQIKVFTKAINKAAKDLEDRKQDAKNNYDDRISEIFESHILIVNDPILIEETKKLIQTGMSAKYAYERAVNFVLKTFAKIDNEYMLGRIVDIIDATDKVKSALFGVSKIVNYFEEDTIIILEQLKPSIIYSLPNHNIKGFISEAGFYTQHSGIIARKIEMPGMVCPGIFDRVKENDFIIIDSNTGDILVNPDEEAVQEYTKEGFQ